MLKMGRRERTSTNEKGGAKSVRRCDSYEFMSKTNQINLTFNNLSYHVMEGVFKKKRKEILKSISGDFRHGELTAIMGPSGAGKSTLLDILAGFARTNITKEIEINGQPRNLASFRRASAYVMQNDFLQTFLTVNESMQLAADLKINVPREEKQKRIDQILKEMSLESARGTKTGELSGGEKKRLSIALELISNPPIMFFDEPTTGLDSVTSRQCLALLKSLARQGRTIVCTIHQPSATLLEMIDHLYVIVDGRCAYSGGTGNLIEFFKTLSLDCPSYHNPADHVLDVVTSDYGDHLSKLIEASGNGTNSSWRGVSRELSTLELESTPKIPLSNTTFYEFESKSSAHYVTGYWKQLSVLLRRNAIKISRDKTLSLMRILTHLTAGLLVGVVFFQVGLDASNTLNNFRLMFFNVFLALFLAFNTTLITFPAELPIVTREHFNRWYKLHSFYIANKLADLPVQVAAVTIYSLIVYFMSAQILELTRFGLSLLVCLLVSLVAQLIGLVVGISMSVQNAVILGTATITPFLAFSGFFVHLTDAPASLSWVFHISFVKYAFEAVMVSMYGYDRPKVPCSKDYCHFSLPSVFLKFIGMDKSNYWVSMAVLVGLYVILDVFAYLVLRLKLIRRQNS